MNKIKNAFNKAQNKVNELAIRAKTAIQNKSGEGYMSWRINMQSYLEYFCAFIRDFASGSFWRLNGTMLI